MKRRVLEGGSREDDDWRVGHPLVFPVMVRVGAQRQHRFQIRVPVDDTHTLHFWYSCYLPRPGAPHRRQDEIPVYDVPFRDERGEFLLDFVDGGDIMTWVTPGADRRPHARDCSSTPTAASCCCAALLFEQIERVRAGEDPLGVVRVADGRTTMIELPQEREKYGDGRRLPRRVDRDEPRPLQPDPRRDRRAARPPRPPG